MSATPPDSTAGRPPSPRARAPAARSRRRRQRGFTLVEVLVALVVMAILAALAWQGLDGILRVREGTGAALDRTLRLNTVVTQWEQDLAALHEVPGIPALKFDGQTLRLTRRTATGVSMVAWAVRNGRWQRWASAPTTRRAALNEHWLRSLQLIGNEPEQVTVAEAVTWHVHYHVDNAWINAQSTGERAGSGDGAPEATPPAPAASGASAPSAAASGGGAAVGAGDPAPPGAAASAPSGASIAARLPGAELLPAAVRLVITLREGQVLRRDVALGPAG